MSKYLIDFICQIYGFITTNMTSSLTKYITFDVSKAAEGSSSVWDIAQTLCNNVFMPVAVGLLLFFFLLELLGKTTEQNTMTAEHFFKLVSKMIITLFIVKNGFNLFTHFVNAGYSVVNKATSVMGSIDTSSNIYKENADVFRNTLGNMHWAVLMVVVIVMLLFLVLSLVIWGYGIIVCLSRIFTIAIMASALPLAIVDIYHGMSSNGYRFIKSFIAVCLQGAIILVILQISNALSMSVSFGSITATSTFFDAIKFIASSFIVQIATIGMLGKSLQITKEFLGA